MTPVDCLTLFVRPACSMLGPDFVDPRADVLLVTIALHESDGLEARRQYAGGPARSLWQFEWIAVVDVLTRAVTAQHAKRLLRYLVYSDTLAAAKVHDILEHNDLLAAGFARLNLRTSPRALPPLGDVEAGWQEYLQVWKPSIEKGRTADDRARWERCYARAMAALGAAPRSEVRVDLARGLELLDQARLAFAGGASVERL